MSALRPAMRRGLLRTGRRSYATPATPSPSASTTGAAKDSAKQTAQKASETAQLSGQAAKEAGGQAAAKAQETGSQAVSKAQETGSQAMSKAQETGSNAMAKAQETGQQALSRAKDALAAAGPMASKLGESTANVVSKLPGGGDKVVSGVQSIVPPAVYYSKVGLEMSKQVMHAQKMTPPSLSTFQSFYAPYYRPLFNSSTYTTLINPTKWQPAIEAVSSRVASLPPPTTMVEQVRGVSRKQWAEYAVLGAEFLGFFTVGEMIGRMKIVGYRGGAPAHH